MRLSQQWRLILGDLPKQLRERVDARARANHRTPAKELALLVRFALGFSPADVEELPPRPIMKRKRTIQRWWHTNQGG